MQIVVDKQLLWAYIRGGGFYGRLGVADYPGGDLAGAGYKERGGHGEAGAEAALMEALQGPRNWFGSGGVIALWNMHQVSNPEYCEPVEIERSGSSVEVSYRERYSVSTLDMNGGY